jgi:hypothetical protein
MEQNQVIEAEATEVKEEVEAKPLEVRLIMHEGEPLEFTINSLRPEDYRAWIAQTVFDMHTGHLLSGIFLGTAFIPMDKIKFFEQII